MSKTDRFQQIHADYGMFVRKVLKKYCSENSIEDVHQDTFIQVFRCLDKVLNSEHLARWLAVVATRCAWRHRGKGFRKNETPGQEWVENGGATYELRLDDRLDIKKWIASLDPTEQSIVSDMYVQGKNSAEVGECLNMAASTVRGRALECKRRFIEL